MRSIPPDGDAPDETATLSIALLGGFRVRVGQREVADSDWRLRKARAVVKLLALAPGRHLLREQVQETLWPEMEPDAAANNLHKAVFVARRAIEPGLVDARSARFLQLRGDAILLGPPEAIRIDVDEFERAAAAARRTGEPDAFDAAVALCTGDLLPEDPYEEWATGRREDLRASYVGLLLTLANLRQERGESAAAVDALQRVVASEPAHEEAHVALMRLHAAAGRRHLALRQYQQLRDNLRRELDVDPSWTSSRLHQDIVTGRVAAAADTGPGPAPPTARGARLPGRGTTLVGRDAEVNTIDEHLDAAFRGRGGVVLVAGEAGIGKSRLVAEVSERMRQRGGAVLSGAAYEQEGRLPYGPFAEALAPLGGMAEPSGLRALLGDDASDFARFPPSAQSALRADRHRLFGAVADLLRHRAAEGPVLLTLEDLHAADHASLQLLHFVARTCRDCRLLVVGTFRPKDVGPADPLSDCVAALRREQLASRINLRRLDSRESDLLVAALLGDPPVARDVAETVYRLADGNPLHASEVVQALREGDRLRRVAGSWHLSGDAAPAGPLLTLLAARLERLGAAAMRTLSVAAVAGSGVSFALLRAVSDDPEGELLDALDHCLARGALLESPTGYQFDHPLRRTAVYDRLGRARRASLHGKIAAAIEELHAGRLEEQAEALGRHWMLSERPGRAVVHLSAAGDRAVALHANDEAAVNYRQALGLLDAPGAPPERHRHAAILWEKLGDLRALAGDAPADADAYQSAISAVGNDAASGSETLVRLHRKAAYAALSRNDLKAVDAHLAASEQRLRDSSAAEWGRVRLLRAMQAWSLGRFDDGRRAAEESLAHARGRDDDLDLLNAYAMLALIFHSSGAWKEGLQLEIERFGASADADPRLALLFDAHLCLGEYHLFGDSPYDAVEAYADRVIEHATRAGARRAEALAWLLRGESLLVRGRWDEARPCLDRSLALQRAVGSAAGQVSTLQRLAELNAYQGDLAAAEARLAEALSLSVGPSMAHHVWARIYATCAFVALDRDEPLEAARAIDAAEGVAERVGACAVCGALLDPVAVEAFVALGDAARAERHAQAAERTAAYWESGAWRAMAGMARAGVEGSRGELAAAVRRYVAASAEFERVGQRFDAARALHAAGRTAATAGDGPTARSLVGRALTTFEALGAATAAARSRTLLGHL